MKFFLVQKSGSAINCWPAVGLPFPPSAAELVPSNSLFCFDVPVSLQAWIKPSFEIPIQPLTLIAPVSRLAHRIVGWDKDLQLLNERICTYSCTYICTKYVLVRTYSVLHVFVRITRTRYLHHDAFSTYLYIFVHTYVHDTYWSGRNPSTRTGQYLVSICTYLSCEYKRTSTYKYWPNTDPVWVEGLRPYQYVLYVFWSVFCTYNRTYAFWIRTYSK